MPRVGLWTTGIRLFGFLGAGATLGQLAGSMAAGLMARAAQSDSKGSTDAAAPARAVGLQLSLLLPAAALLGVAGKLVGRLKRPNDSADDAEAGLSRMVRIQKHHYINRMVKN